MENKYDVKYRLKSTMRLFLQKQLTLNLNTFFVTSQSNQSLTSAFYPICFK